MPLKRRLSEAAFEQAEIDQMTAAYDAALQLLRLTRSKEDPLTEVVAAKIIEVFRAGEQEPARLCARALKELGAPLPDLPIQGPEEHPD